MRWLWQPKPGFVRINHKKLIELQCGALRAAELEAESLVLKRQRNILMAETRALALIEGRVDAVAEDVAAVRGQLNGDELPLTRAGELHEPAFLALLDAEVWQRREQWLARALDGKGA